MEGIQIVGLEEERHSKVHSLDLLREHLVRGLVVVGGRCGKKKSAPKRCSIDSLGVEEWVEAFLLVVSSRYLHLIIEMLTNFAGGGGMFDAGPQFVFNLGGGPGVRVHQFGGARPRRRPRDPHAPQEPPATLRSTIMGLLPLLILFVLPLISSFFSGGSTAAGPSMRFDHA